MKESIIHSLKEKFNDTFCCALCKLYNIVMAVLIKILNLITIEMRKLMQTEGSGNVHDIIDSFKKEIFNARFCKSLCDFWNKIRDFWNQNDIMEMSASVTFYLIMGFIPFLIFGVNIALFTGSVDINSVVETLRIYLTPQSMEVLEEHIEHIVEQTNDIWMFAGLFVSAYSFENGLAILVRATDNETYARRVKKSFLEMTPEKICVHIKSVLYALGLVLVVVVSNILAIFGNSVVGWIGSKFALPTAFLGALNLAIYIIPFIVLIIGLTLFYLFAPYSYTPPISDAFFAAFFVTVLWFVLTVFYRLALMLIPGMGMSYGPVFGLFIMFFWLQYIVAIIIVGLGLIQGNTNNFQNKLDVVRGKENEKQ